MSTVAFVATALSAVVGVERARQRSDRLAVALGGYQADKVRYDQGRLLLERIAEKSEQLLKAELALCWTKQAEAAAIEAHLARVSAFIVQESPLPPHKGSIEAHLDDIERVKNSLTPWQSKLSDLSPPPS